MISLYLIFVQFVSIYICEVFKIEDQNESYSEIVKIIEQCRYDDELSEGYKREILDQEKVFD